MDNPVAEAFERTLTANAEADGLRSKLAQEKVGELIQMHDATIGIVVIPPHL